MSTGFIHINQAVKKYNKTRQTFYNYINKGYVETKKVNNKVFLSINDIEKILNDYIDVNEDTIITPIQITPNSTHTNQEKQPTQENTYNKKESSEDTFKKVTSLFTELEDNISRTLKSQLFTNQHITHNYIEEKQSDTLRTLGTIEHNLQKYKNTQQRILFRIYYLVFVSGNIFILRYIS